MSEQPPEHLILHNPSAGRGRANEVASAAQAALRERGIPFEIRRTESLEHGADLAAEAAAAGRQPVVLSGDGLIGAVGGRLAETGTPLAIIPGGRGNDFARAMGIPVDPVEAAEVVAVGNTSRIDVGEANGKRFLCIASFGFDSDANRIANETRFIHGGPVYAYAGLRALAAWRPATFEITAGDSTRTMTGYSVAVANTCCYGGGMRVAPGADPTDGLFDVVTTADLPKLRFLRGMRRVFEGTHVESDEVAVERAPEVTVSADRSFDIYADGDVLTSLPATIRILPRSLDVVVPGTG